MTLKWLTSGVIESRDLFLKTSGERNSANWPNMSLQADEEGPAVADFSQADGQYLAFGLLLIGDTPAQVHLSPGDAACFTTFAQLGKDAFDQLLTLIVHVAAGGGHKHPHDAR